MQILKEVYVLAIICNQWGDTGKGKFVDIFAIWADIIVRGTGGDNAGHTIYLNGKKYAHEIDPRFGVPVVHNLLSATVVAATCMKADAYATAFMVLGVDSSLQICKSMPDMDCYLIYVDKDGKNQVVYTDGFKKYLSEK